MQDDRAHFPESTATWAVTGAAIGAVGVLVVAAVAIVVSGAGIELMAVAALTAAFAGTGFGAMLGAVLAVLREAAE